MSNTVMYRGLTTGSAMKDLVKDVQTRGVNEGTIEEPSQEKTEWDLHLYISMAKQTDASLLVTIPLKSRQ